MARDVLSKYICIQHGSQDPPPFQRINTDSQVSAAGEQAYITRARGTCDYFLQLLGCVFSLPTADREAYGGATSATAC